jgi:hypothetical protein
MASAFNQNIPQSVGYTAYVYAISQNPEADRNRKRERKEPTPRPIYIY